MGCVGGSAEAIAEIRRLLRVADADWRRDHPGEAAERDRKIAAAFDACRDEDGNFKDDRIFTLLSVMAEGTARAALGKAP